MTNNSVYGKILANLRKRVNVRFVNNAKDYKKNVSKPSFVSRKISNIKFAAIHETKPVLTLNKPIYVGFSISDLTKFLVYEFHYKYIGIKYDNSANLLFPHADSLVYEIETDNINDGVYENKNLFDFSDYLEESKLFEPVSKKLIDRMKDELKGKINSKFVGLRLKMSSLVIVNNQEN